MPQRQQAAVPATPLLRRGSSAGVAASTALSRGDKAMNCLTLLPGWNQAMEVVGACEVSDPPFPGCIFQLFSVQWALVG